MIRDPPQCAVALCIMLLWVASQVQVPTSWQLEPPAGELRKCLSAFHGNCWLVSVLKDLLLLMHCSAMWRGDGPRTTWGLQVQSKEAPRSVQGTLAALSWGWTGVLNMNHGPPLQLSA